MNFSEYIKLIFEGRPPSQNVKAAMEMSDDERANYWKSYSQISKQLFHLNQDFINTFSELGKMYLKN